MEKGCYMLLKMQTHCHGVIQKLATEMQNTLNKPLDWTATAIGTRSNK